MTHRAADYSFDPPKPEPEPTPPAPPLPQTDYSPHMAPEIVPASEAEPDPEASAAMTTEEIAALLDKHAADVIATVEGARWRDDLDAIELAELAGKSRKTVLEAIHDRRLTLEDIASDGSEDQE